MKKGINKQVFTYVILLALIALVAVYFLGYKKYVDLAETTQVSNEALQETVDSLKVYYINEAQYKADMEPMAEEIHEIMEQYPADIREEDILMHAVQTQTQASVAYSNINMDDAEVLQTISKDVVVATAQEDMQSEVTFVEKTGTYVNELDYTALKKSIQAVFDSEYNIGIKRIVYKKADNNGTLSGSIELAFYSMTGNGKEYEEPDMIPYLSGSTNIFGVLYVTLDEEGNILFGESATDIIENMVSEEVQDQESAEE